MTALIRCNSMRNSFAVNRQGKKFKDELRVTNYEWNKVLRRFNQYSRYLRSI
jgi:hypothetical protein